MREIRRFIGIPFKDGGRDPRIGMDYWGLFVAVQKELGNDIPDFHISCFDTFTIGSSFEKETMTRWERIEEPEIGCGVAMELDGKMPGCIQHFGVYVGGGKFIHTLRKVHSCVSSIHDSYWKTRIRGYYRWVG